MNINPNLLQSYIEDKLISAQKHPECDYYIYNYTRKCQFDHVWDAVTMACRGLILDGKGEVIARPIRKFFNMEEHTGEDSKLMKLPKEPFKAFEKLDGSLGILYFMPDGEPRITTRGSFTSDQAIKGTEILKRYIKEKKISVKDLKEIDEIASLMFEIIYPENRIVIDYGKDEKLVLLGSVDKINGYFLPATKNKFFETPEEVTRIEAEPNKEGYVVNYKSGLMVKVKFDEYVRLHRLVTGVNKKTIWELLKNGDNFEELIERVPDEFDKWVKETRKELETSFKYIEKESKAIFARLKSYKKRKTFAKHAVKSDYSNILFSMLDKKDYKQTIWKMIRPVADKPYKEDIDNI